MNRKGVDPDGRGREEELGGAEGEKTIIRIYYVSGKKSLIQIKGKSLHSTLGLFLGKQETQHMQQKGCIYTVHYILCVCVYEYICIISKEVLCLVGVMPETNLEFRLYLSHDWHTALLKYFID